MKNLACLILVLVFFHVASIALSENPSPPPIQKNIEIKTDRYKNNINTKANEKPSPSQAPVIVNKDYTESNKAPRQYPTEKAKNKLNRSNSWTITDFFNLFLVIFTGLLVFCNFLLWCSTRKSANAAKQAANAAKKSADALPTIEKAFIFTTNIEWKPKIDGAKFHHVGDNIIEATLFNGGKTPAILNKVFMTYAFQKEYPNRVEIGKAANVVPSNTIVRAGKSKIERIDITLNQDRWAEMVCHKTKLLCYGRIEYTDIFGKNRETGFCWECLNPQGSTLTISDNNELNYHK